MSDITIRDIDIPVQKHVEVFVQVGVGGGHCRDGLDIPAPSSVGHDRRGDYRLRGRQRLWRPVRLLGHL